MISAISQKQNATPLKPSFGGERLFSVTLQKILKSGKTETIKGFITKMTAQDADFFEKTAKHWENTSYGEVIIADFLNGINIVKQAQQHVPEWIKDLKYFFVECPGELLENQKIRAMTKIDTGWERVNLRYIQSINQNSSEPQIKGAGSCLLYAIGKVAEKLHKQSIFLLPDEDAAEFYLKNGFCYTDQNQRDYCLLRKTDFAGMLKKLEEKYNIKSLSENH